MFQEKGSEGWHDKVSPICALQHWAQVLLCLSQNVKCWCTQVAAQSIPDLNPLFGCCFEMRQEENIKKVQFYQHSSYGALETDFSTHTNLCKILSLSKLWPPSAVFWTGFISWSVCCSLQGMSRQNSPRLARQGPALHSGLKEKGCSWSSALNKSKSPSSPEVCFVKQKKKNPVMRHLIFQS